MECNMKQREKEEEKLNEKLKTETRTEILKQTDKWTWIPKKNMETYDQISKQVKIMEYKVVVQIAYWWEGIGLKRLLSHTRW